MMNEVLKGRVEAIGVILAMAVLMFVAVKATAAAASPVAAQDGESSEAALSKATEAAATWLLETHRNVDGGFSSFSAGAGLAPSDIGGTLDALWGLGVTGADTEPSVAYLEDNVDELEAYVSQDGSTAGKALLAVVATGQDARDFAGLDLVVALTDHLSPTGQFGVNTAFNQSLALMGMSIADQSIPEEAVNWLVAQQAAEGDLAGSWDDGFGTAGNIDSTALALVALRVSGLTNEDQAVAAGLDFLENAQLETGGWEYAAGSGENANSTAMAALALISLGEDIVSDESRWVQDGVGPLEALLAWQSESGAFQADFGAGRFDDFFSTVQALPVLGFGAMSLLRQPVQGDAVTVPEMTPTVTETAVEPTATPVPPTDTPEPTVESPASTPESVAEAQPTEQPAADTGNGPAGESAQAELDAQGDDGPGGGSILVWILGIGAVVVVVGLIWWAFIRRREV